MAFISRLEADDRPWVLRPPMRKNLQGDDPIETALPGLVDRAHAAAAEPLDQLILAQLLRQEGQGLTAGHDHPRPAPPPRRIPVPPGKDRRQAGRGARTKGVLRFGQRG